MKYNWGDKIYKEGHVWQITEVDNDSELQYKISDAERSEWVREDDLVDIYDIEHDCHMSPDDGCDHFSHEVRI